MKTVKVDITFKDSKTGAYLRLPVVPQEIPYNDGDPLTDSAKILSLGIVEFPNGVDLDSLQLESFFPARYDPSYCATSNLKTPVEYRNQFSSWKDAQTPVQVVIPAAGINKTMVVSSFRWALKGFEGDIHYVLMLKEHKKLAPKKVTPGGTVPAQGKKTAAERPAAPKASTGKTYTVKSGDTLTLIAKKLGIKDWRNGLYLPNKGVIGSDPNKIIAGQVLRIP